jgi:Leucine-rich repeat (LRR) protein
MEITPKKIIDNYNNKTLNKDTATDQLIALIESSGNSKIRIKSIELLGEINSNDEVFKLLENLLISDKNEDVRNTAAVVLKHKFIDKSLNPMRWTLHHEESSKCLITILETLVLKIKGLVNSKDSNSKSILLDEIKQIQNKTIKIGFERLLEEKPINILSKKEISDILKDYYAFTVLEKTIWRMKYTIKNCRISEIGFKFKGITKIPEAIKYLSALKNLSMRYNQLIELSTWMGKLFSLERLNVNSNNLTTLPISIGSLSKLKELSLRINSIFHLPNTIGTLRSLKTLNLGTNRLESLPNSIGNLIMLQDLNLHDNKLTFIPNSIGKLNFLESLNVSWNLLSTIPDSIGRLLRLRYLDLGRNEITIIPESLGFLKSLISLNLSENKIKYLPPSFGSMTSLQVLNLSRNNLVDLPNSLGSLKNLRELYITENPIRKLPKSIRALEENGLKIYL